MATNYPYGIDTYTNPTAINHLNDLAVLHHKQHSNINDAMTAVQDWIGVSSSFPLTGGNPYTIEFRIHNVLSGHDHDGINSKAAVLGPPLLSSSFVDGVYFYVSGLFSLQSDTPVGQAVDQINRYLLTVSNSLNNITASFNARQLLILSEDAGGPYEGWEPSAYRELGYNRIFLTQSTWYTNTLKTHKILETFIKYNQNKTISSITQSVYAIDGATILKTAIDTISYNGIIETSRTRTIS